MYEDLQKLYQFYPSFGVTRLRCIYSNLERNYTETMIFLRSEFFEYYVCPEEKKTNNHTKSKNIERCISSGINLSSAEPFRNEFWDVQKMNLTDRMVLFSELRKEISEHFHLNQIYKKYLNSSNANNNYAFVFLLDCKFSKSMQKCN